jgi:site-specific recombinase XerD
MHIDERNNIVPAMFQYASGKLTRATSKFEGDILAFVQSLHNVSEATKEQYISRLRKFVRFLRCKHIHSFERVAKRHIDEFLASYNKPSSKALAMLVLKRFFVEHLKKPELV